MLNETRITSFTLAGIIQSETPISPLRSHMFFIFGIIFIKNLKGSPLCSFSLLKSVIWEESLEKRDMQTN